MIGTGNFGKKDEIRLILLKKPVFLEHTSAALEKNTEDIISKLANLQFTEAKVLTSILLNLQLFECQVSSNNFTGARLRGIKGGLRLCSLIINSTMI